MADQESKGDEYLRLAEKRLAGWGWGDQKYYDAVEYFEKAGNSYKLAKACEEPVRLVTAHANPAQCVHGSSSRPLRLKPYFFSE